MRERDRALRELMDDPACDPDRLAATLRRFGIVNRLVSGWGGVYRTRLRPHLAALGRPARVLDIGSGGGDVVVRLAALAARDGFDIDWLGIDPDPRAHTIATQRIEAVGSDTARISFRCADAATLVAEGETFDVVLSNHVIHHLDDATLPSFADESLALSRGIVVHADIARARTAHLLYAVGITPFAPGTFLRTDGLRSIRRSYRRPELAAALGADWHVESASPFRLLAIGQGRHADGAARA